MDRIIYQDLFGKMERMNEIYLDMTRGMAGDMFVSASYAFMDERRREQFLRRLKDMGIRSGLGMNVDEICLRGLAGFRLSWEASRSAEPRSASDAEETVRRFCSLLDVSDRAAEFAERVVKDIVHAEAEAHGVEPEKVHLHEIGRLEGLANIASAALCQDMLGLREKTLIGSYISIGQGCVNTAHGRLCIPTPASASLLKGLRFRFGPSEGEMATPTGIAIARNALKHQTDILPVPGREGIGFGTRRFGNDLGFVRILSADKEDG